MALPTIRGCSSSNFAPFIMIAMRSKAFGASIAISSSSSTVGKNRSSSAADGHRPLQRARSRRSATSYASASLDSIARMTTFSTSRARYSDGSLMK